MDLIYKKLKYIKVILLITVLVMSFSIHDITMVKAADNSAVMELSAEYDKDSNRLKVDVNILSNSGIAGLVFSVYYDSNVLKLNSAKEGDIFSDAMINDQNKGNIFYVYVNMGDNKSTGCIMSLEYTYTGDLTGNNNLVNLTDIDASNFDEQEVNVNINNGVITTSLLRGENNNSNDDSSDKEKETVTLDMNGIEHVTPFIIITSGDNGSDSLERVSIADSDDDNNTQEQAEGITNNESESDSSGNIIEDTDTNNLSIPYDESTIPLNSVSQKSHKAVIIVAIILLIIIIVAAVVILFLNKTKNKKRRKNDEN